MTEHMNPSENNVCNPSDNGLPLPLPKSKVVMKTTIIMFIDIVDYTTITNLLSRDSFTVLHDVFDDETETAAHKFRGRIIKKIGDAYMLQFTKGADALHCALYLHRSFREHNKRFPSIPLNIRIGINKGPAIVRNGDYFGTSVNIASRLESMGRAGDILFSDGIKNILDDGFYFENLGERSIKGLDYKINVYRIATHCSAEHQQRLKDIV